MSDFKALCEEAAEFFINKYGDISCPDTFAKAFLNDILFAKKISLSKLSKEIGVKQQTLSNIRCGNAKRFTFAVFIRLYKYHKANIQKHEPSISN